jgi:hypothetical protein
MVIDFAPSIATATVASEQIRMSRAKPPRRAEGALDILVCSEKRPSRCDRRLFLNAIY